MFHPATSTQDPRVSDTLMPEVFSALDPLGQLPRKQQHELIKKAQVLAYNPDERVFTQGDRDPYVFYLLEGELELSTNGEMVKRIRGGSEAARYRLARLQPRQLTARAITPITILRLDNAHLEQLLSVCVLAQGRQGQALEVRELDEVETGDWMTSMLQSELFAHIPPANLQQVFTRMSAMSVAAGEVVVEQGQEGDYYYIISQGRCCVSRRLSQSGKSINLAELQPGDSFGEEALVANCRRNATVTMLTDGRLMRLTKEDFCKFIKDPILKALDFEQARAATDAGGQWLDVRLPEEFAMGSLDDAINIPLNLLRTQRRKLRREVHYICCCREGDNSAIAAFLLTQYGFRVSYLRGGLLRTPGATGLLPGEWPAVPRPAPAPGVEHSKGNPRPATRRLESDVRAASLRAELEKVNMRLDEAMKLKDEAERAHQRAHQAALMQRRQEQEKLQRQAQKASVVLAQARRMKADVTAEKDQAKAQASARFAMQEQEIEKLRQEAEISRRRAEQDLDAKLCQERQRIEEQARNAELTLAQVQRLKDELEQTRVEEEAEFRRQRQREEQRLQRMQEELEARRRKAEQEITEKLAAEREQLVQQARDAEQTLAEARRMKAELEQARQQADEEAERNHRRNEQRIRQLQSEAEQRLREEQRKMEAVYQQNAMEMARMLQIKEEAEQRLRQEQEKIREDAEEQQRRMADIHRMQVQAEQARQAAELEASRQRQQQLEAEKKLREEFRQRMLEERRKVETEFLRHAELLDSARRDKQAAEAARKAATEEAERIIQEYKASHEELFAEEQQRLKVERERLERESGRIREMLLAAEKVKHEAENTRQRADQELRHLRAVERKHEACDPRRADGRIKARMDDIQARADAADRQARVASSLRRQAKAAMQANQDSLERQRREESDLRQQLQEDIQSWREELSLMENHEDARALRERREAEMARILMRAREAEEQTRAHNRSLLDDLAAQLGRN